MRLRDLTRTIDLTRQCDMKVHTMHLHADEPTTNLPRSACSSNQHMRASTKPQESRKTVIASIAPFMEIIGRTDVEKEQQHT